MIMTLMVQGEKIKNKKANCCLLLFIITRMIILLIVSLFSNHDVFCVEPCLQFVFNESSGLYAAEVEFVDIFLKMQTKLVYGEGL